MGTVSDDRKLQQAVTEEERRLRASVHRWMGIAATVVTVVAIVVAVWRLNVTLAESQGTVGITLGQSMGIMAGALPWVLLVILLGVLFSLGTTRIFLGVEKLYRLITGKKAGK